MLITINRCRYVTMRNSPLIAHYCIQSKTGPKSSHCTRFAGQSSRACPEKRVPPREVITIMNRVLLLFVLLLPAITRAWDLAGVGSFRFEQVNHNVYVMHGPLGEPDRENQGFMNNPGFIVLDNGIVLIDPGGSVQVGRKVLEEIGKVTDKPVVAVFNTHIHGDHWLGNQAVAELYPDIKMYAHPDMITQARGNEGQVWVDMMERLTEGASKGTTIVTPNRSVVHQDEITVGGQHFRIHSFIPSHTNTDIMIEHVESKTLFMGDNGFNRRMARFDDSSSMHGNIEVLEYARRLGMKVYVPGHGSSGAWDTAIKPFHDYLLLVQKIVQQGFEDGLENYEIKEIALDQVKAYQDWANFETNFGKHIGKMYLEIERREL